MADPQPLSREIYSGVATYGRFQAATGAIIGVIIAIVLVIIGASRLRDTHTATARMTVTAATCNPLPTQPNGQSSGYACVVAVSFTAADGRQYAAPQVSVTSQTPLAVGMAVALRYDPANPADVVQELPPRALGWGLIGGGAIVAVGAVGAAVLAFKSKGFAAVEGTADLVRELRV